MKSLGKMVRIGVLIALLAASWLSHPAAAQSGNTITAGDLIALVNGIRTSNGLPALEISGILMSTAQSTAEIMAANRMSWHIGDVRGRVMAAGYGGGATAWATENFAIGPMSLTDLAWIWSDADHMIPMVKPAYQHIGAGVATAADGSVYYIVQAAYTSGSPAVRTQVPGTTGREPTAPAPQFIIPVSIATPDANGKVVHEVKMGQSLWSIAIAYNTHIVDILRTNNLSPEQQVVWIGQKLTIPVTAAAVTTTGTPPVATPDVTATSTRAVAAVSTRAPVVIRPATQTPVPSPTLAATPVKAAAVPLSSNTIGFVLGGIFAAGVVLIGFGLLSKRPRS